MTIDNMNSLMSNLTDKTRLVLSGIDLTSDYGDIYISPYALRDLEEIELGESYQSMDSYKFAIIKSIQECSQEYQKLRKLYLRFEDSDPMGDIREVIDSIR